MAPSKAFVSYRFFAVSVHLLAGLAIQCQARRHPQAHDILRLTYLMDQWHYLCTYGCLDCPSGWYQTYLRFPRVVMRLLHTRWLFAINVLAWNDFIQEVVAVSQSRSLTWLGKVGSQFIVSHQLTSTSINQGKQMAAIENNKLTLRSEAYQPQPKHTFPAVLRKSRLTVTCNESGLSSETQWAQYIYTVLNTYCLSMMLYPDTA